MEIWKPIKNYKGLYEVSNLGRIKSLPRNGTNGGIIKPWIENGYYRVGLRNNSKPKFYFIHRLICSTFHPNPKHKKEVNHKDGNRLNNASYNIEWNTRKENAIHAGKILNRFGGTWNKAKPVINIKTKKIFNSISLAYKSSKFKYSESYFKQMLRGLYPNKTNFILWKN